MSSVRDVDNGFRRLVAIARRMPSITITVGVHEDAGAKAHPSGNNVAAVATILELGTDKRAPLGWLRNTIDERRTTLARALADAGGRALRGEAPVVAFAAPARELATIMRSRIPVDTATVRDAVEARVDGARVG